MSDTQTISLKQHLFAIEGCWLPATRLFLLVIGLKALDTFWAEATNPLSKSPVQAALQQYRDAQSHLAIARSRNREADPIARLKANFLRPEFI